METHVGVDARMRIPFGIAYMTRVKLIDDVDAGSSRGSNTVETKTHIGSSTVKDDDATLD